MRHNAFRRVTDLRSGYTEVVPHVMSEHEAVLMQERTEAVYELGKTMVPRGLTWRPVLGDAEVVN